MDQIKKYRFVLKHGWFAMLFCFTVFYSCGEKSKTPEYKSVPFEKMKAGATLENVSLEDLVSETDTICGMSLKNGVADTLQIDNKLYGFCSSGCKNKFQTITKRP